MVEATKWAQLTKVEQQIDNFVMRIHVLYIPSLYLSSDNVWETEAENKWLQILHFLQFSTPKKIGDNFLSIDDGSKKKKNHQVSKNTTIMWTKKRTFTHEEIACANRPMWPDLAIFHRSGKISLKNLAIIFSVQLVFGKILNLLWQWFITNGHIYIFVNGQILNK